MNRRLLQGTLVGSLALLGLRLHVAATTGFGDSEALYATYALFPQPGYLDHPGLVGLVARWVGGGTVPSPQAAHRFTALLGGVIPWLGLLGARASGASWAGSLATAICLLLVPELSLGLYALGPDLLLCTAWIAALGAGGVALRSDPKSLRALIATLALGLCVGFAGLAKASGWLLGLTCLVASLRGPVRARWHTAAPWAAAGVALLLLAPWCAWEVRQGFPMLQHRLLAQAGPSPWNLALLVGGQLAYVTPPFLVGAYLVARDLIARRREDPVSAWLWSAVWIPAIPLLLLCLWSRKAEPHWIAPAYLPLALHLARCHVVGRKLARSSVVTGAAITLIGWIWVTTPIGARLTGPLDPSNDLYAWGPGRSLLDDAVDRTIIETRRLPMVVGPHWIVCAQAQATLRGRVPVGCNTPMRDDFDRWLPRQRWLDASVILFVSDSRFSANPERDFPDHRLTASSRATVRRGDRVVRTLRVTRLERDAAHATRQP